MDEEQRREVAIWKVTVLGPLVSARLSHGEVRALCEAAAARCYERPDGTGGAAVVAHDRALVL